MTASSALMLVELGNSTGRVYNQTGGKHDRPTSLELGQKTDTTLLIARPGS